MNKQKIKQAKANWVLYLMILPAFAYVIIFHYIPMYGVQMAFRDFTLRDGMFGSAWVGLKHFRIFFSSPRSGPIIENTIKISLYGLVAGFPIPIIFALFLNQVRMLRFKKLVQTVTYMPNFISVVVITGMISAFFSPNSGFINTIVEAVTGDRVFFTGTPRYFIHLFVWSGIWQGFGWSSIIYVAALSNVDMELHEAAMIDGASRLQRILHIDIPSIMPTMVILLVLSAGGIMSVGFEKVYLMQNDLILTVSEVLSTYTYKQGLLQRQYSLSAAIGLFNNVVNFLMLVIVNFVAKKVNETSLW